MAISRQVHFPSLVILVALMFGFAPAQDTQGSTVYEFCHPDNIIVTVNATSSPFIIQSPNYERNYPDNVNCSLTITSEQDPLVLSYYFRHFDVEYQQFCNFDSLTVNGVNYCGAWEVGRIFPNFLPGSSSTVLRFKTDSSVTKTGFQIIVIPDVAHVYPFPTEL